MTTEERIQKEAAIYLTQFHKEGKTFMSSYIAGATAEAARNKENDIEQQKEIERLKELIHDMYSKGINKKYGHDWEQFKTENNL